MNRELFHFQCARLRVVKIGRTRCGGTAFACGVVVECDILTVDVR